MGGFYSSPGSAELVWYPDEVGGNAPRLHAGYNTYRVTVHGNDYSLSINGQSIVDFPITPSHRGSHIGLWGLAQKLQVKSFQVFRLSSATALPAVPPIKAMALGPSDVPSGFVLAGRADYYTAEEEARLDNVSASALLNKGYVLGYSTDFLAPSAPTTGAYEADSLILAYTSTANAHAAWSADWTSAPTVVKQGAPDAANFASGDVSGIGDEAHWLSYDTSENYYGPPFKITRLAILFRRGTYEDIVGGTFVQGTVSHDDMLKAVTAWAQVVDNRSH
jgi:hypothetical protein